MLEAAPGPRRRRPRHVRRARRHRRGAAPGARLRPRCEGLQGRRPDEKVAMKLALRLRLLRWAKALTLRTVVLMLLAVLASGGFLAIARALKRPAFDRADAAIELFI